MRLPRVSWTALALAGGLNALLCGQEPSASPEADAASGEPESELQPQPKTPGEEDLARFAELDVNRDGWLSGSEANG
ncbi:MAG: hypothetical protein ACREIA_03610, partial [Opitutaceae bacterium]